MSWKGSAVQTCPPRVELPAGAQTCGEQRIWAVLSTAQEWVEVVLLWGFVGWTLVLFFFFYPRVLSILKPKMGFVDSVNVTSDISL